MQAAKEDQAKEKPSEPVHISEPMAEALLRICDRIEKAKKEDASK